MASTSMVCNVCTMGSSFLGPSTSYMNCVDAAKPSSFLGHRMNAGPNTRTVRQRPSGGVSVQALSKRELIEHVARTTAFNQVDTKKVVDTVFEAIVETVSEGEKVTIPGFGTFEPRERAARMGRNPRTGEALEIKAAKLPAFVAGKAFKDAVNGNGGEADDE